MASRRGGMLTLVLAGCLAALCVLAGGAGAARASVVPTSAAATAPPVTEPVTEPVTAPATTAAPTTVSPTTPVATTPAQPTQPVTATTPAVPSVSASPTRGRSSSVLPWILIGLGAVALLGLIAWFAVSSSRRTDATTAWRSGRLNAYAEGAALHDAIMSAEARPLAASDAAVRWAEIQRRANDYTQRLYRLRETAPDEDGHARVDSVLMSLQALRSALDTERASGADWTFKSGMTAGLVGERLNDFRAALHGLRDGAAPALLAVRWFSGSPTAGRGSRALRSGVLRPSPGRSQASRHGCHPLR